MSDHTISLAFSVWHHYLVERPHHALKGLKRISTIENIANR